MSFLSQPAIQSYVDSVTGQDGWTGMAAPNLPNIIGQTDSASVWTQFNFSTGVQISRVTEASLGVNFTVELGSMIQDPSGNVWMFSGSGEPATFNEITYSPSWSVEASWGSAGNAPPTGCPFPSSLTFLTVGSTHWLIDGADVIFGNGNITVLRADPPAYPAGHFGFWGHEYNVDNGATYACAGPQSVSSATAYWTTQLFSFGKTVISSGAETYSPAAWPVPNSKIVSTTIKTYVPTDFDPAWTHITSFSGPAYDTTDGNVILMVGTADSVPNQQYIVKVSTTDGHLIWKAPVEAQSGFDPASITHARIQAGVFLYFAQITVLGSTCHAINTATGTDSTKTFSGIVSLAKQVSDDVLGCVIGECQWNATEGDLTLLNATANSGGPTLSAVYFVTPAPPSGGQKSYFDVWGQ